MQTFLPYPDFTESAKVLDRKRLGKQRVEAWQILQAITNPDYGWQNHPAVKMWSGRAKVLAQYGTRMCSEWINRGYKDTLLQRFEDFLENDGRSWMVPPWIGYLPLHASHRSNLLRKDPEWYGQFGWTEPPDLPYVWPGPGAFHHTSGASSTSGNF